MLLYKYAIQNVNKTILTTVTVPHSYTHTHTYIHIYMLIARLVYIHIATHISILFTLTIIEDYDRGTQSSPCCQSPVNTP